MKVLIYIITPLLTITALFADGPKETPELRSAFGRFVSVQKVEPETRSPLDRFFEALNAGGELHADVDQILEANRINTAEALFQELNGRLDGKRKTISHLEAEIIRVSQSRLPDAQARLSSLMSQKQSAIDDLRAEKLSPAELAAVISFYKGHDARRNPLIRGGGRLYDNTSAARSAIEVTSFPTIELREHGQDLPQVSYTGRESLKWTEAAKPFWAAGLRVEFLELWSQMVNQSAGQMRYRHLDGFEFRFLLELRKFALETKDFNRALTILAAYLTSFNTSRMIRRLGVNPATWPSADRRSLSYAVLALSSLRDNEKALRKLFQYGDLPTDLREIKSVQLSRVVVTFQHAQRIPDRDECLRALKNVKKK